MTKHNLLGEIGFVAKRWKAIAALIGTVATALLAIAPHNTMLQLLVAVFGGLATAGVVHQVPYKGDKPKGGASVVDGVGQTVGGVTETVVGVVDGVTGLLGGLTGKEGG